MSKAAHTNQNPTNQEDTMNPAATATTNQDPAVFGIERLMGLRKWARDHGMSADLREQTGVLTMWDDEVHITVYAGTEHNSAASAVCLDRDLPDYEQDGRGAVLGTYEGALAWLREVTGATDLALVDTADRDDRVIATAPAWDDKEVSERLALLHQEFDLTAPTTAADLEAWAPVMAAIERVAARDMAYISRDDMGMLCLSVRSL